MPVVILTAVKLSRCFLSEIGFLRSVRTAALSPTDPKVIETMVKIAPHLDVSKFLTYVPPRWVGYWISGGRAHAADGAFDVRVSYPGPFAQMIYDLRLLHYGRGNVPPMITARDDPPGHLLLHDTRTQELFVETWEQAEALLASQHPSLLVTESPL